MDERKVYIAGMGMITGLGADVETVFHAVNAGISCYANSGYVTKAHQPVRMALVPQDALPPLNDDIPFCGTYTRWHKHLLQLAHGAITEAMAAYKGEFPIPLILACPEHYPQYPHQIPKGFLTFLTEQTGVEFCPLQSRILHIGRAGVIDAISIARRLMYETEYEHVLVGGVDSYQRPNLLHGLLDEGRVAGPGVMDGFTPGEGAGFLLLTKDTSQALGSKSTRLCLGDAGAGQEVGHMYSDEPYRGEGLSLAVKEALFGYSGPRLSSIYSTMNGENFWSKELGVAKTRHHKKFSEDDTQIEHPADCFGDLGAASGAVLIALSARTLLEHPSPKAHLMCSSSDHTYRSSIPVYTEYTVDSMQEAQQ